MHMQAMNRQLLGQTSTPEALKVGAPRDEVSPYADNLFGSTALQEAANNPQSLEQAGTFGLKEQIQLFSRAPQEAGEQAGVRIGQSGVIFNGHERRTSQRLDEAKRTIDSIRQNQAAPQPESIGGAQQRIEEQNFAKRIKQLEQEIAMQGRRTKAKASGRATLTNAQTKQSQVHAGEAGLTLREKVLKAIGFDIKRESALNMYQQRQAKLNTRKGPGAFLEGGREHKTSMVEQLAIIEANDAQHELTTGE